MTRFMKLWIFAGMTSVYLMQAPCSFGKHGFSMIPNGIIPNPFAGLLGT